MIDVPDCCGIAGKKSACCAAVGTLIASITTVSADEAGFSVPVTTISRVWLPAVRPVLLNSTCWNSLPAGL